MMRQMVLNIVWSVFLNLLRSWWLLCWCTIIAFLILIGSQVWSNFRLDVGIFTICGSTALKSRGKSLCRWWVRLRWSLQLRGKWNKAVACGRGSSWTFIVCREAGVAHIVWSDRLIDGASLVKRWLWLHRRWLLHLYGTMDRCGIRDRCSNSV